MRLPFLFLLRRQTRQQHLRDRRGVGAFDPDALVTMGRAGLDLYERPRHPELARQEAQQRLVRLAIDGRRVHRHLEPLAVQPDQRGCLRTRAGVNVDQYGSAGLARPRIAARLNLRARIAARNRIDRFAPART